MSADWSLYVLSAAPLIAEQPDAFASQRSHAYVKAGVGVPVHVPASAVNVWFSWRLPLTVGAAVFSGAGAAAPAIPRLAKSPPATIARTTGRRRVMRVMSNASLSGVRGVRYPE